MATITVDMHESQQQLLSMLGAAIRRQTGSWRPIAFNKPVNQDVEVSGEQRDQSVKWMMQLNRKFRFNPETVMLAVAIFDHFLHSVKVRPRYLRCIGITCFYLAAKTCEEDEVIPATSEFVEESECGRTMSEVLRMERVVLDKLGWDLNLSTPLQFLHIYHTLLMSKTPHLLDGKGVTPSRQLAQLTSKLFHYTSHHSSLQFSPAVIAAALLSLELESCSAHWLPATVWLQTLARADQYDLIRCREELSRCLQPAETTRVPTPQKRPSVVMLQNGATKRKVEQMEVDEDDNIYDGIKRLYNEDADQVLPTSCARALIGDDMSSIRVLATVN